MATFIDQLLDFIVLHPIVPILFFILCTLSAIPVIILLIATQKCALHRNCRYLITFWCISLLGVLANTVQLQVQMFFYDKGYVPIGIIEPELRPQFLVIHSVFYASSSCFEMFIAFERIRSTFQPQTYHLSGAKWIVLIPMTMFAYSIGTLIGYLIYLDDHHYIGFMIYNGIDLSTLLINTLGIWYCRRRYKSTYGNATLNARYQVNEAYQMARAMHPVYFGSFVFKTIGMAIAYSYIILIAFFDGPIYALMDSGYFAVHVLNCAFASGFLMRMHKSLRKSALKLLPCRLAHSKPRQATIVPLGTGISDTTNQYFNMLDDSWK